LKVYGADSGVAATHRPQVAEIVEILETRVPHAEALKRADIGMHVGFVRSSQIFEMSVIIDRVRITGKCLMLFIKDKAFETQY
jgi:hypothetical protein